MKKRMFLRLDGVRGESENPRHYGAIEISGFSWGGKHPQNSGGGRGTALINDLTVIKPQDKTSALLMLASHRGQHFDNALLTIEEIAEWGSMIRSLIFEFKSIYIDSVTALNEEEETVTINFEKLKMKAC